MAANAPSVLIATAEGSEDMEVIVPLSTLKMAGAHVVLAKVPEDEFDAKSTECMLGRGTRVICDCFIDSAASSRYDVIIAPGGRPGMDVLGKSKTLIELLKEQRKERWVCSSSAGSAVVLGANGLVDNVSVTTHPGFDYLLKKKDGVKKHVVVEERTGKVY
eukprot:TRINITY_DN5263_c0_g1_i2.p1 TRINITY_DN5263_c0_g1~~TRINITY_DN5263_c0_g1_i2.p1  ORF type:complete len:161 (+),score=31.12 TRINITY_DN5263_c0_g1_i2:72-554(+)